MVDREVSFDGENEVNISTCLSRMEQNAKEVDLEAEVECFFDKFSYSAVWVDPNVNMHMINEFMEQINIYDTCELGDETPSKFLELLSASFSSGFGEESMTAKKTAKTADCNNDEPTSPATFFYSTPYQKRSSAKRRNESVALQEFSNTSPILCPPEKSHKVLKKKRLEMSFELL